MTAAAERPDLTDGVVDDLVAILGAVSLLAVAVNSGDLLHTRAKAQRLESAAAQLRLRLDAVAAGTATADPVHIGLLAADRARVHRAGRLLHRRTGGTEAGR